jgi:hypothetical protein
MVRTWGAPFADQGKAVLRAYGEVFGRERGVGFTQGVLEFRATAWGGVHELAPVKIVWEKRKRWLSHY